MATGERLRTVEGIGPEQLSWTTPHRVVSGDGEIGRHAAALGHGEEEGWGQAGARAHDSEHRGPRRNPRRLGLSGEWRSRLWSRVKPETKCFWSGFFTSFWSGVLRNPAHWAFAFVYHLKRKR